VDFAKYSVGRILRMPMMIISTVRGLLWMYLKIINTNGKTAERLIDVWGLKLAK
jgi:hypothetical protein